MYEYLNRYSYSFAPFRGKEFLKDYFKIREKKINEPETKINYIDTLAIQSMELLAKYETTKNLKYLNKALKINDSICARKKLTPLAVDALSYEVVLIRELLAMEEIEWE